jgi:hypothetical protein
MDVTDEFQKVGIFLAQNGFIAVLKEVAMSLIFPVEAYSVSCEQPPHDTGNRQITRP